MNTHTTPEERDEDCPTCEGRGKHHAPSDGYENSKTWQCDDCRGKGTFAAYAKFSGKALKAALAQKETQLADLGEEIKMLQARVARVDAAQAPTPPDPERCQAEKGGAFTMGGGMTRCTEVPVVIAEEKRAGPDGYKGSMSLCEECLEMFKRRMPMVDYVLNNISRPT